MKKEKQLWLPQEGLIRYTLERRCVKNINLRIRPDGSVAVSAPARVSEREIERVLQEKIPFIQAAREKFRRLQSKTVCEPCGADGEWITVDGVSRQVVSRLGSKNAVHVTGHTIELVLHNDTPQMRKKLLQSFLQAECDRLFVPICAAQLKRFTEIYPKFPIQTMPMLQFRTMHTRWGSCRPGRSAITLNMRLLWYPLSCAEYVIVHELAHFLQPNHSAAFYAVLNEMLPDWAARKALLSGIS